MPAQGQGLEDVPGHGAREVAADQVIFLSSGLARAHHVGPAYQIDGSSRQRLVQRGEGRAETVDAALVTQVASASACPRTIAVSSTVWWTSM